MSNVNSRVENEAKGIIFVLRLIFLQLCRRFGSLGAEVKKEEKSLQNWVASSRYHLESAHARKKYTLCAPTYRMIKPLTRVLNAHDVLTKAVVMDTTRIRLSRMRYRRLP